MRIWRLNWGEIDDDRPRWAPVSGQLFAVWPSPVDHDVCFEAAGFADFADSDDAWHEDFDELVRRWVDVMQVAGAVTPDSVREALVAAAKDDNGPPCIVHFGEPRTASIRTSNGHPVLWIWIAEGGIGHILAAVAQGREVSQAKLKWEKLV